MITLTESAAASSSMRRAQRISPGITLDYADGSNESGFKIVNPNAKSTCGCGESFDA